MWNDALAISLFTVTGCLTLVVWLIALAREHRSLRVFATGFTIFSLSFALFMLQGKVPPLLGVLLPNCAIVTAHLFLAWGFRAFYSVRREWPRRFWAYLAASFALIALASILSLSYPARAALVSALIALSLVECLVAVNNEVFRGSRLVVRAAVVSIVSSFLASNLLRVGLLFATRARGLFMDQSALTTITLIVAIAYSVFTIGTALLIDIDRLVSRMSFKALQLERMALNDHLTGIENRYSLERFLDGEIERQDRYLEPLSLIMLDIDRFKEINDTWGHASGDLVLVRIANLVKSEIRSIDRVFRWGGEEFLVILPHTPIEGAFDLAEKLRDLIEKADFEGMRGITASFGVTERFPGEARDVFFRRVDRAMYKAKSEGRNRSTSLRPERADGTQPVSVEWRREWESGIEETDSEHRVLVLRGNRLLNLSITNPAPAIMTKAMDSFMEFCERHFDNEERMLARIGYPRVEEHRSLHAGILADARSLRAELEREIVNPEEFFHLLVDKIVVSHLLEADSDFFPYSKKAAENAGVS